MTMLDTIVSSPLFGISLSIVCFELGVFLRRKTGTHLANPLLTSGILIILLLSVCGISFETYNNGARFITLFLSPCTAMLAINIYSNLDTIKKYLLPILAGTAAAAAASMGSVFLMCKLFGLDRQVLLSLLPKSVTTAIALPLSTMTGGIDAVLVAATTITGALCAMTAPIMTRLFRFRDPVAIGIATGCSGHGIATAAAIRMGPVQGATSGIAIGISGIITVVIYAILFRV